MDVIGGSIDDKLTGLSLGERHRSFNNLIQSSDPQILSPENLCSWTNKTQADQIYIAKLANRTKNAKVLCDIFKTENQMAIAFALKATWLFEGASHPEIANADYFIKEVFPIASRHTVCRIVSLFAAHLESETVSQDFYLKISALYGEELAIKFLPKCGIEFIKSQILFEVIKVPESQLLYIYKKDAKVAVEYLKKRISCKDVKTLPYSYFCYNKLWHLYANDNPKEFLDLYVKYPNNFRINLGGRTTSRILDLGLDDVILKPQFYLNLLHRPTLLNTLKGENLDKFALNLLPENPKKFNCDYPLSLILNLFKPAYRLQFLIKIYALKYKGPSVILLPEFVSWKLTEYLHPEVLNEWALIKIKNIRPEDHLKEEYFLKYVSPDEAIPRMMTLLKAASEIETRINFLEGMIDSCKIYKDEESLLKVLKYVAQRHRNDQERLRFRFLDHLQSSFTLHSLSSEHWAIINEMLEFMCVSKEIETYHRQHFLSSYLEPYLRFSLDNNLPIDPIIDKYITHKINSTNILLGIPKYETIVLDAFFAKYKVIIERDLKTDEARGMVENLLSWYQKRSDKKNHSVTECTWLIDVIKQLLDGPDKPYYILSLLREDIRARAMFADMIFTNNYTDKLCENFLRHDASVIIRNMTFLLERCLQTYTLPSFVRFFRKVRAYMGKPLTELFEKGIREHSEKNKGKEAVSTLALSLLLSFEETEKMIKKFYPTVTKVDLAKHAEEYVNGQIIAKGLMMIEPPVSYETVFQFAKDDYLKYTVPSLLSLPFKKSSKDSLVFIEQLLGKPVSVKKNGIRLAYFLYPRKELLDLFKKLWAVEKNVSIREVVFQRTFKLLQTERDVQKCKEIWETIQKFMHTFSELDKPLFRYLTCMQDVKLMLILEYFETSWAVVKRLEREKVNVSVEFSSLCQMAHSYKVHFSEEFCQVLIDEYFAAEEKTSVSENLLIFLAFYILEANSLEQQQGLFKKLVSEKWSPEHSQDSTKMNSLKSFILKCCQLSLTANLNVDPIHILNDLSVLLSSRLPFETIFDLDVVLSSYIKWREIVDGCTYAALQVDSPEASKVFKSFGKKICSYLIETCDKLGNEIYPVFYSAFETFYKYFLIVFSQNTNIPIQFIQGFMENKSNMCYVMALDLLDVNTDRKSHLHFMLMNRIRREGSSRVLIIMNQKYGTDAGLKIPDDC